MRLIGGTKKTTKTGKMDLTRLKGTKFMKVALGAEAKGEGEYRAKDLKKMDSQSGEKIWFSI